MNEKFQKKPELQWNICFQFKVPSLSLILMSKFKAFMPSLLKATAPGNIRNLSHLCFHHKIYEAS